MVVAVGSTTGTGTAAPEDGSWVGLLGIDGLARVIDDLPFGVAVLAEDLGVLHVNPAGCAIVGVGGDALLRRRMPPPAESLIGSSAASEPGGGVQREIESSDTPVEARGRSLTVRVFRDVTEERQAVRREATLNHLAARIARAGSLETTLNAVAECLVESTQMNGCAAVVLDGEPAQLRVAGTAGLPADYAERCRQMLRLCDEGLPTVSAFRSQRTVVVDRERDEPLLRELEELDGGLPWRSIVSFPMVARNYPVGAVKTFWPGPPPGGEELRFLAAVADQAAAAVDNARLFTEAQQRLASEARHRLARELHDSVSQSLFSITLETRGAQLLLERTGLPADGPLGERLGNLRQLAQGALAEMRALIFELRPEALREEGLTAAIRKQAEGMSARTEIAVEVRAPQRRIPLPAAVEEQVYRMVQEALTNIARHSGARRAVVQLHRQRRGRELLVEIADDGVGFDPSTPQPGHLGLRTMAQRIEQLGGVLLVDTHPGRGTRICATIPLSRTATPMGPAAGIRPARRQL